MNAPNRWSGLGDEHSDKSELVYKSLCQSLGFAVRLQIIGVDL